MATAQERIVPGGPAARSLLLNAEGFRAGSSDIEVEEPGVISDEDCEGALSALNGAITWTEHKDVESNLLGTDESFMIGVAECERDKTISEAPSLTLSVGASGTR